MGYMSNISELYLRIAETIGPLLQAAARTDENLRHWIFVQNGTTTSSAEIEDLVVPVHEVLARHLADGALGAAYVTHNSETNLVIAYAVVTGPPHTSDVREARVLARDDGSVELSSWYPSV
jgi:hypothetical protein